MKLEHRSVLLDRCITVLSTSLENKEKPVLVDATLGLGGHSLALLEKFPNLQIIGIDRDKSAIDKASQRLSSHLDRITIFMLFMTRPQNSLILLEFHRLMESSLI